MSAIASAQQNDSPIARARRPRARRCAGGRARCRRSTTSRSSARSRSSPRPPDATDEIPGLVDEALATALRPHSGPTFVDFPMDLVFSEATGAGAAAATLPDAAQAEPAPTAALERAIALLRDAERPVIMAGTNLYWGHGEHALLALAEERGIPVFLNGLARGCVPADHELFFSRARGDGAEGRRRRARRSACRWTSASASAPRSARRPRSSSSTAPSPSATIRGPSPPSSYGGIAAILDDAAQRRRRRGTRHERLGRRTCAPTRTSKRAAERAELEDDALAAAPDAALQGARRGARPRRDRHRRRRRLRLLRRARRRLLRAGLLAGPGPVRLPGLRARATRSPPSSRTPTARSCCCSATAPSASAGWSSTRSRATA